MEEVAKELKLLKKELNDKFDRLFELLKSAESANVPVEENQVKADEDRIPQKFRLSNEQLNELRVFFGYRNEAEKIEETMAKFLELEKSTKIDGILKDISNSIELIKGDLVEKRRKIAEMKVSIEINYDQETIDVAQEYFENNIEDFELEKEDIDLSESYVEWVLNNKMEDNPVDMESGIEPNSSRGSTPKRYSSDDGSMVSSKRSRNLSVSTTDSRSSSDIMVIDPHPDLVSLNDTPIVRLVTTSSPKMERMLDLLSDKQRISMLAVDPGWDYQVRNGVCYRLAVRIAQCSKIGKTGFWSIQCRYFNFEVQKDNRQTFFSSFERNNESFPYLLIITDGRVRYNANQLYLCNLRLSFPRSERGRLSNQIMSTDGKIYINGLDNMTAIKTIKISP